MNQSIKSKSIRSISSEILELGAEFRRQKLPLRILLLMSLNLVVAPAVQAATGSELSRSQAYALGILGLVTLALSIYLFFVMFVPEKF